jgi:hypothetical protein
MLLLKPDQDIVMMQSADPVNYFPMLRATSRVNRAFCVAQDIHYTCHYGIMRGFHPWHACYNRIYMLANVIELGFTGWYVHVDADAWVQDTAYDLRGYLRGIPDASFVFTQGASLEPWDVNDGVFFANCAHPDTQAVARAWKAGAMAIGADDLRAATQWYQVRSDQQLLHAVLKQDDNRLCGAIQREHPRFINGPGPGTRFIRQILRSAYDDADKRWDLIELGAERALGQHATQPDAAIGTFCAMARALDLPIPAEREAIRAIMADKASLLEFLRQTLAEATP